MNRFRNIWKLPNFYELWVEWDITQEDVICMGFTMGTDNFPNLKLKMRFCHFSHSCEVHPTKFLDLMLRNTPWDWPDHFASKLKLWGLSWASQSSPSRDLRSKSSWAYHQMRSWRQSALSWMQMVTWNQKKLITIINWEFGIFKDWNWYTSNKLSFNHLFICNS